MKEKILSIFSVFLNSLIVIALVFTNICSGVLAGSYLANNVQVINLIINVIALINIVVYIIKNKKFKFHMIDLGVLIFTFSFFIPLIFHKYYRIQDTVEYIFWYLSAFNIYFTVRLLDWKKYKKVYWYIFSFGTILTSIILILIGIDDLSFRNLHDFRLSLEGVIDYATSNTRLDSTFEYPNSFAICIAFSVILCLINYIKINKKVIMSFIDTCITIIFLGLFLTGSRMSMAVLLVGLIISFIVNRKNKKNVLLILHFLIDAICSIIASNYVLDAIEELNYSLIIISFCLILVINFVISLLINIYYEKLSKKFEKINKKKMLIAVFTFFIAIVILVLILINVKSEIKISVDSSNKIENSKLKITRIISDVEPNTEYTFKFNVNSIVKDNQNFIIFIKEYDNLEEFIEQKEIKIKDLNGDVEESIKTNSKTKTIRIVIRPSSSLKYGTIKINSMSINGKNFVLDYKFLPAKLISRFTSEITTTKSVNQRLVFIKDGFKILKDTWVFGRGGNAWMYQYKSYIDYNYTSRDVHSFPMQIFLQNGIVGFASIVFLFLLLIILMIKNIKGKNKKNILLLVAIFSVLIHSFLDMDMSFFYNIYQIFMYIGIVVALTYVNGEDVEESKKSDIINNIFIVVMVIYLLILLNQTVNIFIAKEKYKESDHEVEFSDDKYFDIVSKDPTNFTYRKKRLNYLLGYEHDFKNEITDMTKDEQINEAINHAKYILNHNIIEGKIEYEVILLECYVNKLTKDNVDDVIDQIYYYNDIVKENVERQSINKDYGYENLKKVLEQKKLDINDNRLVELYNSIYAE